MGGEASRTRSWWPSALLGCVALAGCHVDTHGPGRATVADDLGGRMQVATVVGSGSPVCPLPPEVVVEDGLTEDEAVAVAVWNNALLNETLTEIGVSRARLYDAGLLIDPQFTMFLPLGPKQFEMTIFQSVDAIWLRPIRVRAAKLDLNVVAQRMVQSGLDVIRDTRVAHADLLLAQERSTLANEASDLRSELRDLAEKRLAAGDVGELEVMTIRVEALRAAADAKRFARDVDVARHRLVQLIGLRDGSEPFALRSIEPLPPVRDRESLVGEALAMRPDLRAAEIDVEAACRRTELARNQFMTFDAAYDANSRGVKGFESGPGLRFTLPIFNGNKGGQQIANASFTQAVSRTETIRDQIALEVRTAHTEVERAAENLRAVRDEILPALEEATELARSNYESGGAPYFLVLQTTSQFLDARARELELEAELARAIANLERGVGHRLADTIEATPIELGPDLGPAPAPPIGEPAELPLPISEIEQVSGRTGMADAGSPVLRLENALPADPPAAPPEQPSPTGEAASWTPPMGPVFYPRRFDHDPRLRRIER